jgi:hypothetical protein
MIKTVSLLFICLLTVTLYSCKKTYSCECTSGASSLSQEWEDLTTEQANDAEKACDANHKVAMFSNDSCSFQKH